jgi:hypothetical protein
MAEPAPELSLVPADTALSDRQLLIHLLQHVEDMHEEQRRFSELLADFGPLIEKWKSRGGRWARL